MTDRLYERISLDTLVSGSIQKQHSRLAKHATQGFVTYEERSVSGSKVAFADRPEGRRLLADLERGDRVLVTKIDRAARNVRDLLGLVELIEERGASIVFVDQNIDTAGPMGRFLLTLLGAIAELEAGIIAERRRESLAQFRDEGRHAVGRAPFGLRSVQNPNGRGLVLRPDPEEAPLLLDAVARIMAGESQRTLSRELGVMGEPAFSRLLRNERLAGILGTSADGVRLDPDMAIFSLTEWRRLQDYLQRPEKAWSNADGIGPALACGVCGERLYLNLSKRSTAYSTYRCRKARHAPGQPGASVIAANADAHVETDFLARFGHLSITEEITTDSSTAREEAIAIARMQLDAARAAQDEAETDEDEEATHRAYLRAKKALRTAEALPSESVTEEIETGETFAQRWASSDWPARVDLILRVGAYVVEPGRLPLAEKIHADETAQDYLAGQD